MGSFLTPGTVVALLGIVAVFGIVFMLYWEIGKDDRQSRRYLKNKRRRSKR